MLYNIILIIVTFAPFAWIAFDLENWDKQKKEQAAKRSRRQAANINSFAAAMIERKG